MCAICTRCGRDSTRCWRAKGAPSWRKAASISFRHARYLTWKAGPSRTFSHTRCLGLIRPRGDPVPARVRGEYVLGEKTFAVSLDSVLTDFVVDPRSGYGADRAPPPVAEWAVDATEITS